MSFRVGLGYDAHRLVKGRPLFLGGVRISYEKGLEGHSDADVILHAIVDALLGAEVPAAAVWGAATYLVEQYGCRRILDTTFMAGFMFGPTTDSDDVERYFRALKRAQMELDLEPERYKHYYLKEIPARYHADIDVRCFGPGERVVFLPYTTEMYERAQESLHSDANRWVNMQRLYSTQERERPVAEIAGLSEWQMRNQYRAWRHYMTLDPAYA